MFPIRRVYDLRHTFATFSLRAGLSTFDLSRYMGTSLVNTTAPTGTLALDAREHALDLLDAYGSTARRRSQVVDVGGRFVDVAEPTVLH